MSPRKKAARKQAPPVPLLLAIGGGVLLILTAILTTGNSRPSAVTPASPQNVQAEIPYAEGERVSLFDAKAALDAGTAIFVDVRGDDVYAMSHIPGSLSIPLGELQTSLGELDSTQWIITYCT